MTGEKKGKELNSTPLKRVCLFPPTDGKILWRDCFLFRENALLLQTERFPNMYKWGTFRHHAFGEINKINKLTYGAESRLSVFTTTGGGFAWNKEQHS